MRILLQCSVILVHIPLRCSAILIQKSPTTDLSNPEFCERWCEITNNRSFDLMVLIIQETTNQLDKICQQIQDTRTILEKDCVDKDKLRDCFLECDQYKEKIEMEIRTIKNNEF